jgi:hypothetical protein
MQAALEEWLISDFAARYGKVRCSPVSNSVNEFTIFYQNIELLNTVAILLHHV